MKIIIYECINKFDVNELTTVFRNELSIFLAISAEDVKRILSENNISIVIIGELSEERLFESMSEEFPLTIFVFVGKADNLHDSNLLQLLSEKEVMKLLNELKSKKEIRRRL